MAYINMMPAELAAKYTRENLWLQKTAFDILAERAAAHPDRIAIKDQNGAYQLWRAQGEDRTRSAVLSFTSASGAATL